MVAQRKAIKVTPESDLIHLLDDAAEEPLLLEKDGVVFRLSVADNTDDLWAGYDPERTRRILREMAGSISQEEAERIKALIRKGRDEGTRPANRP
jgi:hypothetical protein